jgi:RHS repeat-associated protein
LTNGTVLSRTVIRDPYRRHLVTVVSNAVAGSVASDYHYNYDLLSRVTSRNTDEFGYNPRSEVTSTVIQPSHTNRYEYDGIGNALWASLNAATSAYTANALNQYTNIANGSIVEPEYDLDGKLTCDDRFGYVWDAENRLTAVYSNSLCIVSNTYDHMSRRVLKVTPTASHTFVYDGWNLVCEILRPASGAPSTNLYVWGKDLSGTLQGAGGVGGLLAISLNGSWYFPLYDNNGNVTAYVDESGDLVAEYAYDAFGLLVTQSGAMAGAFPHRFSTKYFDSETGQYYYGHRYYSPELGRWLSRDPIVEEGGVNLYAFVANDPNDNVDLLGLIDLRRIPGIMRANGWNEAGTLLDRWFGNPTIGPVQSDTTTIRMDWVLGFARARTVYDSIFSGAIYRNDAAKREIMRLLIRTGARAGDYFGNLNRPVLDVDNNYVNSRVVGSPSDPLDGLLAALGRFQFRIAVEGSVCAIRPTSALVQLHRVGVYVRDSFDFQGEQHLGYWNDRTNYGGRNPFRGDAVRNRDFRAYSAANGVGQDFRVYSDIKITDLALPPETIFVRQ